MSKTHLPRAQRDDYGTPDSIYEPLHREFGFTLDAAADSKNTKCATYYTKQDNSLMQPWSGVVWCNPPYGHATTRPFVRKGWESSQEGATVVMLVPAYTASAWWHDYAMQGEVRFIRGKVQFVGQPDRALFASAIVIFRPPTP